MEDGGCVRGVGREVTDEESEGREMGDGGQSWQSGSHCLRSIFREGVRSGRSGLWEGVRRGVGCGGGIVRRENYLNISIQIWCHLNQIFSSFCNDCDFISVYAP
jgi:hypothetical protein